MSLLSGARSVGPVLAYFLLGDRGGWGRPDPGAAGRRL